MLTRSDAQSRIKTISRATYDLALDVIQKNVQEKVTLLCWSFTFLLMKVKSCSRMSTISILSVDNCRVESKGNEVRAEMSCQVNMISTHNVLVNRFNRLGCRSSLGSLHTLSWIRCVNK